jgi:hypothetical protein
MTKALQRCNDPIQRKSPPKTERCFRESCLGHAKSPCNARAGPPVRSAGINSWRTLRMPDHHRIMALCCRAGKGPQQSHPESPCFCAFMACNVLEANRPADAAEGRTNNSPNVVCHTTNFCLHSLRMTHHVRVPNSWNVQTLHSWFTESPRKSVCHC